MNDDQYARVDRKLDAIQSSVGDLRVLVAAHVSSPGHRWTATKKAWIGILSSGSVGLLLALIPKMAR